MESFYLVVNTSYWDFFNGKNLKEQEFLADTKNIFSPDYDTNKKVINLASALKERDTHKHSIYGIEIKTNGSSRSSRIPLVRYTKENQTIFKIVKTLKEVDDGVNYLKKLMHELKSSRKEAGLSLPLMGLIVLSDEKEYVNDDSLRKYVIDTVSKNKLLWFSGSFLETLLISTRTKDIDKLLEDKVKIYINGVI
jgi:hypothetical protein